jgi:hypothetical protein
MNVKCPNCSQELPHSELNDGWCGSCGKEIPLFAYHGAGLKGPERHVLTGIKVAVPSPAAVQTDRDDGPPRWQMAIIGFVVLSIAAIIVYSLA